MALSADFLQDASRWCHTADIRVSNVMHAVLEKANIGKTAHCQGLPCRWSNERANEFTKIIAGSFPGCSVTLIERSDHCSLKIDWGVITPSTPSPAAPSAGPAAQRSVHVV